MQMINTNATEVKIWQWKLLWQVYVSSSAVNFSKFVQTITLLAASLGNQERLSMELKSVRQMYVSRKYFNDVPNKIIVNFQLSSC